MVGQTIKIAVVGDVHDQWQEADRLALHHLGVDLVLFVGDFGDESVEIVRAIAAVDLPKAAVMGNHDAWYVGRRRKSTSTEDRIQQQLDLLGSAHVGFSFLDFPEFDLSVVGSRPFSWGGQEWRNSSFYRDRFGVNDFMESTERMMSAVQEAGHQNIIFLGHNGPLGLGDRPWDICGRDWLPHGGDYGDPDLADAIAQTRLLGKNVGLVAFGHMHHELLRIKQDKKMRIPVVVHPEGTVYLNAARFPRIVPRDQGCDRNFSLVSMENGVVTQASLVWLDQNFEIVLEEILVARSNLQK